MRPVDRLSTPEATVEVRSGAPGEPLRLAGYAARFGSPSAALRDEGGRPFREVIRPGAFARALAEGQDVRALFNHDPALVLGRTASGTLSLREDGLGLWFEAVLPETGWARDLAATIGRGDVSQCSFSFACRSDGWSQREGLPLRELRDVDLFDVGPVTFPAYPATAVALRSVRVPAPVEWARHPVPARARARVRLAMRGN